MRVATWNLYLGADLSLLFDMPDATALGERIAMIREQLDQTRFAERSKALARVLAREHPDVVGLQEVCRWVRTDADGTETVVEEFLPTLLSDLEAAGCAYDAHAEIASFTGGVPVDDTWLAVTVGNAVLVRRGSGVVVSAERTGTYDATHVVATGIEGVSFPVVRSWGRVDLEVDGTSLGFVNTHVEAWDAAAMAAQREQLLSEAAGEGDRAVVVGDFNARPDAVGMPAPYVDAWTAGEGEGFSCGDDPVLTSPDGAPSERIDYVWVRGAAVERAWRAGHEDADRTTPTGMRPSDHVCVLADLSL